MGNYTFKKLSLYSATFASFCIYVWVCAYGEVGRINPNKNY